MIAGLLVANGDGWSTPEGVLPKASVLSIQIGSDNGATTRDLALAILKAVNGGAKVINISMGTTEPSPQLESAVNYAISHRVVIVASAGNHYSGHDEYPAAYPDVIAVSAINKDGQLCCGTNYNDLHDITAPGDSLLTSASSPMGWQWINGSSAATPLVTSLCAILLSEHRTFDAAQLRNVLFSSAKHRNVDGKDIKILDVQAALKLANTIDKEGGCPR